jgi:hypothetical protein
MTTPPAPKTTWCETCRDVHSEGQPHVGEIDLMTPEKRELLDEINRRHAAELDAFFASEDV